jgi:hypothetical protein
MADNMGVTNPVVKTIPGCPLEKGPLVDLPIYPLNMVDLSIVFCRFTRGYMIYKWLVGDLLLFYEVTEITRKILLSWGPLLS